MRNNRAAMRTRAAVRAQLNRPALPATPDAPPRRSDRIQAPEPFEHPVIKLKRSTGFRVMRPVFDANGQIVEHEPIGEFATFISAVTFAALEKWNSAVYDNRSNKRVSMTYRPPKLAAVKEDANG